MRLPRETGFWIEATAVVLSLGLCLASIVLSGPAGLISLRVGVVLFIPASVRLASRLSGVPILSTSDRAPGKVRPIWSAVYFLAIGLMILARVRSLAAPHSLEDYLNIVVGMVSVVLIGFGVFRILAMIVGRLTVRADPAR